eukprot:ANDGO_07634.mRNA.1 hypothetical protein
MTESSLRKWIVQYRTQCMDIHNHLASLSHLVPAVSSAVAASSMESVSELSELRQAESRAMALGPCDRDLDATLERIGSLDSTLVLVLSTTLSTVRSSSVCFADPQALFNASVSLLRHSALLWKHILDCDLRSIDDALEKAECARRRAARQTFVSASSAAGEV